MATGLIALLDDVAALAKVAAASIDDTAAAAAKASAKAAGVVVDDAAVTPRYVTGFAADRELPIVAKIAKGSLRNKLLFLLPAALLLSWAAPWAITPILMLGGLYLCFEGAEKLWEKIAPHDTHALPGDPTAETDPVAFENTMVAGAIRTDFILSAEIMAIALATIETGTIWTRGIVLAVVAIGITAAVYGTVALIVKADDLGVALSRRGGPLAAVGRGLVVGMPVFLKILAAVGTAAMLWVGGGIILHGAAEYGIAGPEHAIAHVAELAGHATGPLAAAVTWLVNAAGAGLVGLVLGGIIVAALHLVPRKH